VARMRPCGMASSVVSFSLVMSGMTETPVSKATESEGEFGEEERGDDEDGSPVSVAGEDLVPAADELRVPEDLPETAHEDD